MNNRSISLRDKLKEQKQRIQQLVSNPVITEDQMLNHFESFAVSRLMDSATTWSIHGYRCFHDMVSDTGTSLAKVGNGFGKSSCTLFIVVSSMIATCSGTVRKAITGRRWTDTGRKLPGRKVARTAVTSLAAADEHEQKLKDAHRVHQVLFDESAKQLMVALVHWDTDLDSPEITSAGVQRLRKQDAHTVGFHVMDRVKHVRQVGNGLSDNCPGMAAMYNGAMLAVFRDLKSVDKTPRFSVVEVDPEMPPLSHDDGGEAALPEEQ